MSGCTPARYLAHLFFRRPDLLLSTDAFARLCRSRELLRDGARHPLSISELAREACMSRFHFIRRFEALFGVTPHQFRIASRLHDAQVLLAAGNHSVTEVCMEVGWSSLGSFSDLFSRRFGTSPSDYRRRARILVSVPASVPHVLFPGCLSLMLALPASAFRNFQEARPAALR